MNEFRKNMHVAYKKKLSGIILMFVKSVDDDIAGFAKDPISFVEKWVDGNCLPMGDFSKEDAIKEMEAWQE